MNESMTDLMRRYQTDAKFYAMVNEAIRWMETFGMSDSDLVEIAQLAVFRKTQIEVLRAQRKAQRN